MEEIRQHALNLLKRRDYTVAQIRLRLIEKFGEAPDQLINWLVGKRFLDDRRFAENFVARNAEKYPGLVREELIQAGVAEETVEAAVASNKWPSLQTVLKAKMNVLKLHAPIRRRDAARLFRILYRLGYQDDEIREELEQLHEE